VLREALAGVWEPVRTSARPDEAYSEVERLSSRITRDYLGRYEQAADHFTTHLGDERKFRLRAAWKRREIVQHSRAMAEGMSRTITERRASLDAKLETRLAEARAKRAAGKETPTLREIRAESAQEWHKWLQYKQRQLDGILQARAQLEAQTDVLVHSGLANPLKDRIMFFGGSPAPCSLCVMIQGGNPYTIAQARSIGGVAHPHCFPAGTVAMAPDAIRGYRAWYEGPMLEVSLSSGARLTVTPHHKLMTRQGLTPAEALREGDDLICCSDFQRVGAAYPDDHGQPAMIEQVFDALSVAGGVSSAVVPVAAEDFHGDGRFMQGEVNVVAAAEDLLSARDMVAAEFIGGGNAATVFLGLARAAHRSVSRLRVMSAFFRRPSPMFAVKGVQVGAQHTSIAHPHLNSRIGAAECARQNSARLSGDIPADDLIRVQNWWYALLHQIKSKQQVAEPFSTASQRGSDGAQGLTLQVTTDHIIRIEQRAFCGHVYDLQTVSSLYLANGVLASNCRDFWQEFAPVGVDLEKLPTMQEQWRVARAPLDVTRQRVRDGSVTLWDGRPVTPARGWAKDKEVGLRQMRDPWKRIPGRVETMQQKNAQVGK
jgi:hypothetical protein